MLQNRMSGDLIYFLLDAVVLQLMLCYIAAIVLMILGGELMKWAAVIQFLVAPFET